LSCIAQHEQRDEKAKESIYSFKSVVIVRVGFGSKALKKREDDFDDEDPKKMDAAFSAVKVAEVNW